MLEQLVRPFQLRPIADTRRIVVFPTDPTPLDPAVLAWGDVGTLPEPIQEDAPADPNSGFGFKLQVCDDNYTEKSRGTKIKRITNPQNPANFVDVEIIENVSFTKSEKEKILSTFHTTTTSFGGTAVDADPVFGDFTSKQNKCQSDFVLKNT